MGEKSLVSILMTAYNRERYIGEAIESVLQCTYDNWELIIVDDCSSDNTVPIAQSFSEKDQRIKLFINEKNLGDYPNRNKAAGYANGRYLVNVDSDDTMFPEALKKWIEAMQEADSNFGIFAKMGNERPVVLSPEEAIHKHFFETPILMFGPGATIVSKDYFVKMNGFPVKYGPANDMYHHLKLAAGTGTMIFPFPLINYRLHDSQELNNKFGYLYNNYNYYKDALAEIPLPLSVKELQYLSKKNKRRFITNIFKYWRQSKNFKQTKFALNKAQFTVADFLSGLL